jgi:hypothetical protein
MYVQRPGANLLRREQIAKESWGKRRAVHGKIEFGYSTHIICCLPFEEIL